MKNAWHSRVSASTPGVLLGCTFISSSGNDRRRIAFRCAYRAGVTRFRRARDTPEKQLGNDVDAAFPRAKLRVQASFRREKNHRWMAFLAFSARRYAATPRAPNACGAARDTRVKQRRAGCAAARRDTAPHMTCAPLACRLQHCVVGRARSTIARTRPHQTTSDHLRRRPARGAGYVPSSSLLRKWPTSRIGGAPNSRLYSRLNCDALS